MAGADRHRAGPHRRTVGGDGGAVEHLVHQVEAGPARGEGDGGHYRRGPRDHRQTDQPEGEQRGTPMATSIEGAAWKRRPMSIPRGSADTSTALSMGL